uniref:non-specific serine/threonine protein kinase n=1 Tax=Graphocephala atropunctata TaxID=36148 RepID=A0A1B6MAT7_9HEMI
MVKPPYKTYGKNKPKLKPVNSNVLNLHFHVTNNYVTNYFLCKSESSGDEFDKLLKGTAIDRNSSKTPVSRSTSIVRKEQFWPRQDTASFYNSDATPESSSLSSAGLFKDSCKDAFDLYSLSNIPSPPSYTRCKKKLVKVKIHKNKRNKVFKRKMTKVIKASPKALERPSPMMQLVSGNSSTPIDPCLKVERQWFETHMSPIIATYPVNGSECRYSTDVLGNEAAQERGSVAKPKQSFSLSALVEGLGKLELVTPCAKTKRKPRTIGVWEKELSVETPPPNERIQENTNSVKYTKRKTLHSGTNEPKKNEESSFNNERSYECQWASVNNEKIHEFQEARVNYERVNESPQASVNYEIINEFQERFLSGTCSNSAVINSRKQTRSKLTVDSQTQQDLTEGCYEENEQLEQEKSIKDETHEFIDSRNQQVKTSESFVCEASTSFSSISKCKIKDLVQEATPVKVEGAYNMDQSSCVFKPDEGSSQKDFVPLKTNNSFSTKIKEDNSEPASIRVLRSSVLPLSDQPQAPSDRFSFKKPNISLLPGKAWRRSLLQQKQCSGESRRCTIGPALISKLIKDAPNINQSLVNSLFSNNTTAKREDIDKGNNTTTFEASSNFSIFNNSEIFNRVSIRPRRRMERANLFCPDRQFMHNISEEASNPAAGEALVGCGHDASIVSVLEEREDSIHSLVDDHRSNSPEMTFSEEESEIESPEQEEVNPMTSEVSEALTKLDVSMFLDSSKKSSSEKTFNKDSQRNVDDSFGTANQFEQTSVFETPPILRMNANALSTITKRRKKSFTKESFRDFNLFEDEKDSSDEEYFQGEGTAWGMEDLAPAPSIALILTLCGVDSPVPFVEVFPDRLVAGGKKIGEGVFGEVFLINRTQSEQSVIKIIPVEGKKLVNGVPQKCFEEVLPELIISEALTSLRTNPDYCTTGFCELKNKFCLQGEYPKTFKDMWCEYDRLKKSENDNVEMFDGDQLYIALELANAGDALETYCLPSAKQSYSIFLQVVFTLAVAESELLFEHRDLHYGNILVKKTSDKYTDFVHNKIGIKVPTIGYKATIIDFTLSRITYKEEALFLDLANDPEQFEGQGDYQFDIYRFMRDDLNNDWSLHAPVTNLRWLHYLADKLVTRVKYKNKDSRQHKEFLKSLRNLKSMLEDFSSASELAEYFSQTYEDTMKFIKVDW